MSRMRRNTSSPVQLFPFLAVLMSMMGALILLLLAINRQAAQQAIAATVRLLVKQTSEEEVSLARRKQQLDQNVATLREQLDQIKRREQRVDGDLVQADGRNRDDAARAEFTRRELADLRAARAESEQRIAAIRQQVAAIEAAKQRADEQQRTSGPTFVPVVHPGTNGTTRKPIYLECTADAVVLQPERIAVPAVSLANDAATLEAFARAVRALAAYHLGRDAGLTKGATSSDAEPYPLLLVRPGGVNAYYAARQAIEGLGMPFGYELIEADWSLRFPDPDPQTRAVALAALQRRSRGTGRGGFAAGRGAVGSRSGRGLAGEEPGTGQDLGTEPGAIGGLPTLTPDIGDLRSPFARGGGGADGSAREPGQGPLKLAASSGFAAENPSERPESGGGGGSTGNSTEPITPDRNPGGDREERDSRASDSETTRRATETRQANDGRQPFARRDGDESREPTRVDTVRRNGPRGARGDENSDANTERGSPRGLPLTANPQSGGRLAIPRKIHAQCLTDRLVVGPRGVVISIPASGSLDEVVGTLVDEIEQQVATWGPPGLTFRWQPFLVCDVSGDSLENFYRLRFALAGSSITVEHTLADSDDLLSDIGFLGNSQSKNLNPQSSILNPRSSVFNPQRSTLNPQPSPE